MYRSCSFTWQRHKWAFVNRSQEILEDDICNVGLEMDEVKFGVHVLSTDVEQNPNMG
jgi:hypothetical protein